MDLKSPLEMLYQWESEAPDKIYTRQPIDGVYHEHTWKQTGEEVRKMAAVLKGLNLPPKSKIGILSKNCTHWILSDLAIMMSGHISVPMYPTLSANTVKQILEHSETKVLFVGKLDDYPSMKPGVPDDVYCITYPFYSHTEYDNWDDLTAKVEPIKENIVRDKDELATIIYTSGTTGMPKGVMHKFYNFAFTATHAFKALGMSENSRFFSYLPLSHIAERLLVEMGSIYTGGSVAFAETLDTFAKNLADSKPTVFLGVPRIWTKFQQGILKKLPQKKLDTLLKIPILSGIIKKKIKTGLGLNEATNIFTGAAPTPVSLIKWFEKIGIRLQEAYAMTENACYSHVSLNDKIKIGYVGAPLPYCEVKLSEEGEILIKHEALMDGYYKEPEMTTESFVDGYLRTGDKGEIDNEGFLKITGRVKDIFKTSKGKYIAPSPIESKLSININLEQICVVGIGIPQPIVLVVLSEEAKKKPKDEIKAGLEKTLEVVNAELDHHEVLKKLIVLKEDWTVENGLLTPTMKVKRNELEKIHTGKYEAWYEQGESVIWE